MKGAWEIDHVFGGGNGKDMYKKGNEWILNAGADVTGNTNTLLIGGYIHEAYGGSNEKGTIGGNVTINTNSEHEDCACDLELVKLYGAGKNADIEGDLIVVLGCAPETKTEEVYGGAENANVRGNVELTITSGTFGKVFGGNNQSGAIFGHIILNIEETGCRPINIDELYGCGNNAAYSVYGYKNGGTDWEGFPIYVPRTSTDDGTAVTFDGKPHTVPDATTGQYDDPEVNIISCTRIGKVFGGGLGSGATVYGNPTVNIDQIPGAFAAQIDRDGDDVADKVSHAHAARDEHAERYRGVDVAARDVADAVRHADDDKTERESGQNVAAAVRRVAADEHRGAAAEYHENHGADKFGDELFDRIHSITPP